MAGGAARFVLVVALVLPVLIFGLSVNFLAGTSFASPSVVAAQSGSPLLSKRPIGLQTAVSPTLVPPATATPAPAALVAAAASPTPRPATYVVQPGDELKHIAADYGVDIFKLIRANELADPDNLRVGQVLKIPDAR